MEKDNRERCGPRFMLFSLCFTVLTACYNADDPNSGAGAEERNGAEETGVKELTIPPKPVQIGLDGPRFNACNRVGRVANIGDATLPVMAAPFDNAERIDQLEEGRGVSICVNSIDQQWLGIIYDPDFTKLGLEGEATESQSFRQQREKCGVAAPVVRKQNYTGDCASGWVKSAFVRLIAG